MTLELDKNSRVMQFFAPDAEHPAGVYYPKNLTISPVSDGVVSYDGGSDINIFMGEILAVPRHVISMDISTDFRSAGKVSDIPLSLPTIKTQPQSELVDAGGAVTLQVIADANATEYQWFKDGEWVGGATSEILSITDADESDEGVYFCRVSNPRGSVDTATARIGIRVASFDVTIEYKDFSEPQNGSAMRSGFLDVPHAGAAGDCVPREFTYDGETHTVIELSGSEANNEIRFRVTDVSILLPEQLRLFSPNMGVMATLTRNVQSSGYIGVNSEMKDYLRRHAGETQEMSIALV
ncbi:immunoglobulin domain-containing protein [Vibrio harveyi]|uniref:immunoglobulin domain-containing protein n=1 Tax=Vibrio harveyi TaxID=669 RepID=UPI000681E821|nr:immunoglobulin domain-containing protein [Vibrio harveyi]